MESKALIEILPQLVTSHTISAGETWTKIPSLNWSSKQFHPAWSEKASGAMYKGVPTLLTDLTKMSSTTFKAERVVIKTFTMMSKQPVCCTT